MNAHITNQSEIPDADTKTLVNTYNWLTGKAIKKFSSRAAGEVQVANAMLIAADRAGHKGVPKGAKPNIADGAAGATAAPSKLETKMKTKADALGDVTKALAGTNTKLKPVRPARKHARSPVNAVQFVKGGKSRLQEGSVRNAVLQYIVAGKDGVRTLDELEKHFKHACRGYVQKLLDRDHLKIVD